MRRWLRILGFHLRSAAKLSRLRVAWWRLQGMRIDQGASIGRIHVTWPHAVAIGARSLIEHDVYFKVDGPYSPPIRIRVGADVFVGAGVEFNIKEQLVIGDLALIASGCRFIDHDHGFEQGTPIRCQKGLIEPIAVGADAWLGVNVVVLKGVVIGDGAVVAAGAVVNASIPSGEIWGGVPARRIGIRPTTK